MSLVEICDCTRKTDLGSISPSVFLETDSSRSKRMVRLMAGKVCCAKKGLSFSCMIGGCAVV